MKRRNFLQNLFALGTAGSASTLANVAQAQDRVAPEQAKAALQKANQAAPKIEKLTLPDAEWKKRLTPAQYAVLRDESTERSGTSPLDHEKRAGVFHCAGCDLPVYSSDMKYNSGTGWPSFFTTLPGAFEKKTDFKMIYPRTEYHCARCGGHHGHLFTDGPQPTGQRWCNNGVSLVFKASA
ncbi:MAG: peptide-methionine (R)-S-oxide reductase MsrB [Betaproteobacteria bacterium]